MNANKSPELQAEIARTFALWEIEKITLARAKERELELRKQFATLAGDNSKLEGTEAVTLPDGRLVKIVKELRYSFTDKDAAQDALIAIASSSVEGSFLAPRLVRTSIELIVSEYRKLPVQYKTILDAALSTKETPPQLEIVSK